MPKPCVKNVYTQRNNSSIFSANLSTNRSNTTNNDQPLWIQIQFIRPITRHFTSPLSTTLKLLFNLLNKSFTHNPQHLLMRLIR